MRWVGSFDIADEETSGLIAQTKQLRDFGRRKEARAGCDQLNSRENKDKSAIARADTLVATAPDHQCEPPLDAV